MTAVEDMVSRLASEYEKCADTCNLVYAWYSLREGRYQDDDTAQAWLRIINENFNRAQTLFFIKNGYRPPGLPGIDYVPGAPSYRGKAT